MNALPEIFNECCLTVSQYEPVRGGEINTAFCLHTKDQKYFLKINHAGRYPGMLEQEAKGLVALRDKSRLVIPSVIRYGVIQQQQYLLLEWMDAGKTTMNFWREFGQDLAQLHRNSASYFGWPEDNYIGSLLQANHRHDSWYSFYAEWRIMPMVKHLFDAGLFLMKDIESAEFFCNKLDQLFPSEPPALLHGDLWGGNFMVTKKGRPVIFDPAVYYGHREMDIGMTRLFGGFEEEFYTAYNEVWPLETGWQQRLQLTQLYPLLVHAVLFGGHYPMAAKTIIGQYI